MSEISRSSNLRPFLYLRRGPINQLRRASQGGGRKFRENAIKHGQLLLSQVHELNKEIEGIDSSRPDAFPQLTDSVQLVVEGNVSSDILRRLDINVIDEREGKKFIGVSQDSSLGTLSERVNLYMNEETGMGNPVFNDQIAPINIIRPTRREDRIGITLQKWIAEGRLSSIQSERYDIEIAGGNTVEGERNRLEFNLYLQSFEELFPPSEDGSQIYHWEELTVLTNDYSIHRTLLPGIVVEDLLDNPKVEWLLLIDRIPQIEDDTIRLREINAGSILPLPQIDAEAPRVVVVDSGITTGHPLFSDANNTIVGRQFCFLPTWFDSTQDTADHVNRGHGTSVSSVVAYGSLTSYLLDHDTWSFPQFWVENAKILYAATRFNEADPEDDRAKLHELQVPHWLMQQVVTAFHQTDPKHCRIFNLSIGASPVKLDKVPSSWSEAIDNLSANNDVLFIVAAGNIHLHEIENLQNEVGQYPKYLLSEKARLRDPAQALNAITVGALSENDILPATNRNTYQAIAPANHPAPFSRTGLRDYPIVKPDVVEYGGNLSLNKTTNSLWDNIFEMAVPVANRNFLSGNPIGIIGYQCGTSIAAPKVSHLAGLIQKHNPDISANLIRALIINSADWPQPEIFNLVPHPFGTEDGIEIRRNMLQICGYGIPKIDKALAANPYCIVLFAEGSFQWDPYNENDSTANGRYASKVSFFRATINSEDLTQPDILDEKVRISITIAYNPSVRKTNNAYQAVNMSWDLMREDETIDNFETRLMKVSDNFNTPTDNRPWFLKPVLNPGNKKRKGTVIRDWFDTDLCQVPSELEVAVTATVSDWYLPTEPLTQKFAIVFSIETLSKRTPIYDRVRIQTRIPIKT